MHRLMQEVYGDGYKFNYRLSRLIRELDQNGDGKISFVEFKDMSDRFPILMFPAFRMQHVLRQNVRLALRATRQVFGEDYWIEAFMERSRRGITGLESIWTLIHNRDTEFTETELRTIASLKE
jgi:hypothetical protein